MREWFEGKTVAIIGNAMSLFDKEYGKEIDAHDVVVRLNKAAMLYDKFDAENSHGKRTDVWMFWRTAEYKKYFSKIDVKILKMHMGHQDRKSLDLKLVDHVYPNSLYSSLKKVSGKHNNPTTGFMAIDYVLNCDPSILNVYGFDWKETPTYTDPDRKKDKVCPHDHETEKIYCKNEIFTRENVFHKN
jgi:hypothetical protein